jgi:integrase
MLLPDVPGNPLTRDSVYQLVSRACFEQTGKRTNPHLLRDMIVTHVRESSNASEKELEALALFMGHSLQMQRTSYDRRTLSSKVAPAVQLLTEVNARAATQSESSMSQA